MKTTGAPKNQTNLEDAWKAMIADPACLADRARNQASQFVKGQGPVPARLMLVGEAPGREEDRQGQPFVGRAGQLLDRALEAVGLERSKIYITNIVKYRPDQNRTPSQAEVNNCQSLFEAEIDSVAPDIIGCLGLTAGRYFFEGLNLGKDHGRILPNHRQDQRPIIVACYHPAAGLYNPIYSDRLIDDLRRIKNLYQPTSSVSVK